MSEGLPDAFVSLLGVEKLRPPATKVTLYSTNRVVVCFCMKWPNPGNLAVQKRGYMMIGSGDLSSKD